MRHLWVLIILLSVGAPRLVSAQAGIPVYDLENHLVNTVTSIQSVITATQSILLVADSVTNLTSFGSLVITGAAFAEDIGELQGLLEEAEGLAFDIHSLELQISSLLALESAPDSMRALRERLWELRRARSQSYLYALRVQTLINTAKRIAERIVRIVEQLAEMFGNLTGHQNVSEWMGQLTQAQVTHHATVVAFERAETVKGAEEPLVLESVERINDAIMVDWPGG